MKGSAASDHVSRMRTFFSRVLGAALIAATLSLAAPAHADDPIPEEARVNFEAGVALLQDPAKPRYEEAYRRFQAAYAIAPVARMLGNIGLCAMKLERDGEAIAAYEKYLKDVPDIEAGERAQIERDLLTLRTGVTKLVVSSDPPGATLLDTRITTAGDDVTNAYGLVNGSIELSLREGHHVLRARLPNRAEQVYEFEANGGAAPPKRFEFPEEAAPAPTPATEGALGHEAAPKERPIPTSVYVGGGLTGALAIATVVTGGFALGAGDDFKTANDGTHPEHAEDLRQSAGTLNVVADVLLVSTIVAGLATTYLFLSRPERDAASASARLRVRPRGAVLRF
jgi:hypothetical protein